MPKSRSPPAVSITYSVAQALVPAVPRLVSALFGPKRKGFGWQRWSRLWLYDELGLFKDYRVRKPEVARNANSE